MGLGQVVPFSFIAATVLKSVLATLMFESKQYSAFEAVECTRFRYTGQEIILNKSSVKNVDISDNHLIAGCVFPWVLYSVQ